MKSFIVVIAAMAAGAAAVSDEPVASFPASQSATSVAGGCPNDCSGNGYCRDDAKCLCFAGYVGYDCSQRDCPSSPAWGVDNAILSKAVECSYRGSCNRNTGECACFEGFEGAACERTSCPNSCSGHGRCRSINELALATSYTGWEASRIQTCDCDGGYFGSDCSLRKCPVGDDPQSTCGEQNVQVQVLTIKFPTADPSLPQGTASSIAADLTTAGQVLEGDFAFTFLDNLGNEWTTRKIPDIVNAAATGAAGVATVIKNAIKELPNFAASDVTVYVNQDGSATNANFVKSTGGLLKVRVEFSGATVSGTQPKMQCPGPFLGCPFRGCQPKYMGPRVVTQTATTRASLIGTDAVYDWLPQPSAHADRTEPQIISSLVDWKDPSATGAQPVFSVITKTSGTDGVVDGTTGNAALYHQYHGAYTVAQSGSFELGMGLRAQLANSITTGGVAGAAIATDEYHVLVPGCSVEILEEADQGKEDMECAGRGLCDRSSGLCQCFEGYSGYACNEVHISI